MASTKKSRTVNKVSPSKDGAKFKKSMQRKRKLSDMLGPQWRKEELEHFYEAYRKYGKDWKKVVAAVRNRSVEMVDALYMMNRAYLSLPEGAASVVGFIAMMTDHHCNLVGKDSDPESSDEGETPQKSQKLGHGSVQTKISKEFRKKLTSHLETTSSKSDDLSILETKPSGGTQPRTVGKRTPRFPISFSKNVGGGKFVSPTRQGLKLNTGFGGASQKRSGSLPVSRLSNRRTGNVLSLPSWSGDRMGTELGSTSAKYLSDKGELARGRGFLFGSEDAGTAKGKGIQKSDNDYVVNKQLDGIKEASGGTEEQNFGVKPGKIARHIARKNSEKARDERSAFDALQILADLYLKIAATATENESTMNVKDKDNNLDRKYGLLETYYTTHPLDRLKPRGVNTKGNQAGYGEFVAKNLGKGSVLDTNGISEIKEQYPSRLSRKKQKIFISKIPRAGVHTVTHLSESQEAQARDAGNKATGGGHSSFCTSQQKQGKWITYPENSSPSADLRREKHESALTTAQVPVSNQAVLPGKVRSRHRKDLQKPQNLKDLNKNDILSNCLSNGQLRQWCIFEWLQCY